LCDKTQNVFKNSADELDVEVFFILLL